MDRGRPFKLEPSVDHQGAQMEQIAEMGPGAWYVQDETPQYGQGPSQSPRHGWLRRPLPGDRRVGPLDAAVPVTDLLGEETLQPEATWVRPPAGGGPGTGRWEEEDWWIASTPARDHAGPVAEALNSTSGRRGGDEEEALWARYGDPSTRGYRGPYGEPGFADDGYGGRRSVEANVSQPGVSWRAPDNDPPRRYHIGHNQITKLAIPRIGCGLDILDWGRVKKMLEFIFRGINVEIVVCNHH